MTHQHCGGTLYVKRAGRGAVALVCVRCQCTRVIRAGGPAPPHLARSAATDRPDKPDWINFDVPAHWVA